MGTSFEQFKAVLRNDYARHAIGLDISANEAERVASDPVLARAYYDNWLRLGSKAAPKPPASSGMDGHTALPRHSMPAPVAYAGAQPLRDFETSVPHHPLLTRTSTSLGCRSPASCCPLSATS